MAELIQKKALYEQVADRLRTRIYNNDFTPGTPIDERALCAAMGISRTPLREALKVLQHEGLVELVPNRGCFVRDVDDQELDELFPVMAVIEGLCARSAVERLDERVLAELEKLHQRLEDSAARDDINSYYEANCRFHMAVQNLTGNRLLQRIASDLRRVLRLARHNQLTAPGRLQQSLDEHRALMHALRRRDADTAEAVMRGHLLAQWEILRHTDQDNETTVARHETA